MPSLERLPLVVLVSQHLLNHEELLPEVHAGDQAVLVAANVEDQSPRFLPDVGRTERFFHGRIMPPLGASRDFEKPLKRPARVGMFRCEPRQNGLAQHSNVSMFPYLGIAVKPLNFD